MFCPDGVVDIPEACGAKFAQRAFNPGSNPGRDAFFLVEIRRVGSYYVGLSRSFNHECFVKQI
jgi:hypothetical protein